MLTQGGASVIVLDARREVNLMTLQERMIQYRAKERINQVELANRVGVTVQTINSVENGKQAPSKVTIAKIELVIGKEEEKDAVIS